MKKIFTLAAVGAFTSLLVSCGTSKKFSYKDAYHFSYYDYSKSAAETPDSMPALSASADPEAVMQLAGSPSAIETPEQPDAETPDPEIRKAIRELKADKAALLEKASLLKDEELKGKERRELKKEVRKEAKDFRKKVKNLEKEKDVKQLTGYLRTGVILGAVGLGTMILGSLFGVSALITVGVLLVLGGIVFLLIDLI